MEKYLNYINKRLQKHSEPAMTAELVMQAQSQASNELMVVGNPDAE